MVPDSRSGSGMVQDLQPCHNSGAPESKQILTYNPLWTFIVGHDFQLAAPELTI